MKSYCGLAKQAVEKYIREGEILNISKKMPAEFKKKAGVFVTIFNQGKLRGCIGTYLPTKANLAQEIIDNAISAASHDWRFEPITKRELSQLSYEISVLEKPILVKNIKELNSKKFGIIVKGQTSNRSALLLPDLKGINTVEKQLTACLQKAGIDSEMESISIFRFQTKKYN
jgi:AmmeMemoRadiSam system protein A